MTVVLTWATVPSEWHLVHCYIKWLMVWSCCNVLSKMSPSWRTDQEIISPAKHKIISLIRKWKMSIKYLYLSHSVVLQLRLQSSQFLFCLPSDLFGWQSPGFLDQKNSFIKLMVYSLKDYIDYVRLEFDSSMLQMPPLQSLLISNSQQENITENVLEEWGMLLSYLLQLAPNRGEAWSSGSQVCHYNSATYRQTWNRYVWNGNISTSLRISM